MHAQNVTTCEGTDRLTDDSHDAFARRFSKSSKYTLTVVNCKLLARSKGHHRAIGSAARNRSVRPLP